MNHQLPAKACLFGHAMKTRLLLLLFTISAFVFESCKRHEAEWHPEVVGVSPSPGQMDVDLESMITVIFNRSMDSASTSRSIVVNSAEGIVSGTVEFNDTAFRFVPERDLQPNTIYTVMVQRTAMDVSGQQLENDYIFRFTSRKPDAYTMRKTSEHVTDFDRDGSRIIQIGEYMYSFGGWTGSPEESYSDVYRSLDLVNWEKRPDAPWHGRHVFGLVKMNGAVYVIGGDNLHNEFDVWKTSDGENWIQKADNILGNRSLFGCAAHNGYLYVVGGADASDVWRSADGANWIKITGDLPFLNGENFAGSLVSYNGRLWMVCGGGTGGGTGAPRRSVWSSADGISWRQEPDFEGSERYYTDVCVWDNKIWVVGGYNYTEHNVRSIWYMSKGNVWKEMPVADDFIGRHATGVGVFNGSLVIANGSYNNDCWVIEKLK